MTKRIVVVSDLHAGSSTGLWPDRRAGRAQRVLLDRWADCIAHFGERPDILICNGDAVDGKQRKGGDLLDDNVDRQAEAAANLLEMWRPRECFVVSGTGYHTSDTGDEAEALVVTLLKRAGLVASYHRKITVRINGWWEGQWRHHIGSSGIPHGRHTPQSRSKTWQAINAAINGRPLSQLCGYGHVHYWAYSEDAIGAVVTGPCWQALGGRYGDERCDGHVDIGAYQVTVGATKEEGWSWAKRLYPAAVGRRTVER